MQQASNIESIVAITTRAAESFVDSYYALMDSSNRSSTLIRLYSPNSRISWNGNPIPFNDLINFLDKLPRSTTEVQAFDCHPIPQSNASPELSPAILVSVTGQVTHGDHAPITSITTTARDFEFLPRVFSQSFILAFDPVASASGELQYTITADAFRFVG